MNEKELNGWFCSLPTKRKEHIAAKILLKDGGDVHLAKYPNCTAIWLQIDKVLKERIYDHCTNKHGDCVDDWQEGDVFSF